MWDGVDWDSLWVGSGIEHLRRRLKNIKILKRGVPIQGPQIT